MPQFIKDCKQEFAYYGFICSPLSDKQIKQCYVKGLDVTGVYNIGCDIAAGFEFTLEGL